MEDLDVDKSFDRHRKKRFYNSIRDQIEFYLGDVNLSKDRFFNKLLEESPCTYHNLIHFRIFRVNLSPEFALFFRYRNRNDFTM